MRGLGVAHVPLEASISDGEIFNKTQNSRQAIFGSRTCL